MEQPEDGAQASGPPVADRSAARPGRDRSSEAVDMKKAAQRGAASGETSHQ